MIHKIEVEPLLSFLSKNLALLITALRRCNSLQAMMVLVAASESVIA